MATVQEAVRRLTIVATGKGLVETKGQLDRLSQSQAGVTETSRRQERATLSMERRLDSIRRRYDTNYRAQTTLAKVERDLNAARAQGLITLRRQNELMALATARARGQAAATGTLAASLGSARAVLASFGLVGGAVGAVFAAREVVGYADAWTRTQNALKVAGVEGDRLSAVYDRLYRSAQRNVAPVEALVELYSRASLVQGELGVTTEELLGFTDKVAVALRVSGRSAQESSGALLQLSQALGSGIVRAEEFNSILEGALPIAQAAAAGLKEAGGSVSRLRALVVEGKVSSEAFFRAFEAGAGILDQKVAGAELTVSQSFIRLQNVLITSVGRFDDATGASELLAGGLGAVADGLERISEGEGPFAQAMGEYANKMNGLGESAERLWRNPSWANLYDFLFVGSRNTPEQNLDKARSSAFDKLRAALEEQKSVSAPLPPAGRPVGEGGAARFAAAFGGSAGAVSLSDYTLPATETATEQQQKAFEKLAGSLALAQANLHATARQQEINNNLAQLGAGATEKQRTTIELLTGQLYDQKEALEQASRGAQIFGDTLFDALDSIVLRGENAGEVILNLIQQLALAEAKAQFMNAISPGQASPGPLSLIGSFLSAGVFHGSGVVGEAARRRYVHPGAFMGAEVMHDGGLVGANERPIIAELGEEVLRRDDPRHRMNGGRSASGGGGANITFNNRIDGADAGTIAALQSRLALMEATIGPQVEAKLRQLRISNPGIFA